jgi:hypothetical protein
MKNQIKILMAAGVLAMSGCSTTGALDAAMDQNSKAKKADYNVMEAEYKKWLRREGKLTVEAARRFVLPNWLRENQMDVHFSNDPFTTELFAYVLADRTDEIEWTPERIALLRSRTESCDRARQAGANALIELAANINTPTIDPRTGLPIYQGYRKFESTRLTTSGSCNGVLALGQAFANAPDNKVGGASATPKNKLEIE